MTARPRRTECIADATLYMAFELGSTKWTLGFTTAPAQRPRIRAIAAGDLGALEREVIAAKVRFGLPWRRRSGVVTKRPGWLLGASLAGGARHGERRGGFIEH